MDTSRKIRSSHITGFYTTMVVDDTQITKVTGTITIVVDNGNEITVFQSSKPIGRDVFASKFAALETALNEPWYGIPDNVEYQP